MSPVRTLIGTLTGEDSRYSMTKKIASRLLKTIILAILHSHLSIPDGWE